MECIFEFSQRIFEIECVCLERMSDRKIGTMSFNEIVDVIKYNYSKGNFNYAVTVYTIAVHIGAIIGIFTVPYCHPYTLLFAFLLWISR